MMQGFTVSAFSDEYDSSLKAQCKALADLGIGYMEMRFVDGKNVSVLTEQEVKEAKRVLSAHGIGVSAIGSPLGKIKLDGDTQAHYETAKRVFETACALDAKRVRIFSFYLPDGESREACKGRVYAELERLLLLAETYGVTLCHENEAGIYGESPECCLDLVQHFGGKLRTVLDMGNFVLDGHDPLAAYGLLRDSIEYFHIKDALSAGAIVPAGKGEAKIGEILAKHRAYTSREIFITLEPHLQTFSGLNALVGKSFDNPYKYENQQIAFTSAWEHLKNCLTALS